MLSFGEIITTLSIGSLIILLIYYILYSKSFQKRSNVALIPYLSNGTWGATKSFLTGVSIPNHWKSVYDGIAQKCRKRGRPLLGFGVVFGEPTLFVGDMGLIKATMVTDSSVFEDRRDFGITRKDFLIRQMLFALRGEEWRIWRAKLSYMTSAVKVKHYVPAFETSSRRLVKYIEAQLKPNCNGAEVDWSLAVKKFTMDAIIAILVGLDSGALEQEKPTIYEEMGDKMGVDFGGFQFLRLIIMLSAPKVAEFLGISIVSQEAQHWWSDLFKKMLRERLERGSEQNKVDDFVQMTLKGRELGEVLELEEGEKLLIANSTQLLLAGLDTMGCGLVFALYALAINPDVQVKLREELELEGDSGSADTGKYSYLDMVISETLRMYPPVVGVDRMANVDYQIPGTDFILKKGELIYFSIYGIHHDPINYENPHIFNPLRFENKEAARRYCYLPFGTGPRGCIAPHFARQQLKIAVAALVKVFRIEPTSKTDIPMQFSNMDVLTSKRPIVLYFTKL